MPNRLFKSESKFLERARTALTNAQTDSIIKAALTDYSMGEEQIAQGQQIFDTTYGVWSANTTEDAETTKASGQYKNTYAQLQSIFKEHRDKSIIYFKKQPEILVQLGVKGRFPQKYNDFFDKTGQYYNTIKNDATIQTQLSRIKINDAAVNECLALHTELLAKRSNFDKELAESQNMTKNKNAALIELKEWMEDFDSIAKIALYDQPQLLEALGIFVRS